MNTEKASTRLFLVCFVMYALNCLGKLSFSPVTASVVSEGILTKTQAGTVSAGFWLFYAGGQLLGGICAYKFSPYKLIIIGLVGSATANIAMSFLGGFIPMLIVWSLNGALQFGIWPSILRIMSTNIIKEHRAKSCFYISFCYCVGTIFSFLGASAVLSALTWHYVFWLGATANLFSAFLVYYAQKKYLPYLPQDCVDSKKVSSKITPKLFFGSGLALFLVIPFVKSLTETGIKNWMPTLLMEIYGAQPSYTSLLTVVLLLVNLVGVAISAWIYKVLKENEIKAIAALYLLALPAALVMIKYRCFGIYAATFLLTYMTVMIYGSGQNISIYYPTRFEAFGVSASIGGIINSAAAFGNVVGVYGFGRFADLYGWNVIVYSWIILICVIIAVSLILLPVYKKFMSNR